MPETHHCHLLRTTSELESFCSSWQTLWKEDLHATPFQSPQWLLPWWHQFGTLYLRAAVVSRNGKPLLFLPFYVYRDPPTQERRLLLLGVGTTDYLDGIFAPECGTQDVLMALDVLRDESGWDVLHVNQLRPESLLFRTLQQADELGIHSLEGEPCSRMDAAPRSELPTKIRRNAMYYRNRASRTGSLEFLTAGDADWPAAFDTLVRLHTTRWKSLGDSGVLADPRVLAWHREAIPMLQQQGMLHLCSLRLNGEFLGVAYSLADPVRRSPRTYYVYLMAHSPEHAKLRPGTLLLAELTEQAANAGIDTIDMLRGDEDYKKLWHTQRVPTYGFIMPPIMREQRLLSA